MNIKMKNVMLTTQRRAKQAGLTLIEALLVLALSAAGLFIAYQGYKAGTGDVKSSTQTKAAIEIIGNVTRLYGQSGNYAGVTNTQLVNAGYIPDGLRTTAAGVVTNAWGGAVTIEPGTGTTGITVPAPLNTTSYFRVVFAGIEQADCVDFVSGIASAASALYVNAVANVAKPQGGVYDPAAAVTGCTGAGTKTVVLISN